MSVEPFFTALPDIVEGNEDDENSRRLLAELMAICASIRMVDNAVMRLSSTYDPAVQPTEEDPEPDQPTPETISLPVSRARFSVGVVGLKEHVAEIAALRAELPPAVYLWVNAYKREPDYYPPDVAADT